MLLLPPGVDACVVMCKQAMTTEASADNSEESGDSEGAMNKAYARFKPLAGVYAHSAAARQDGEAETSGNSAERGRVFYGHDGYYVFFRLHQCLYERCADLHTLMWQPHSREQSSAMHEVGVIAQMVSKADLPCGLFTPWLLSRLPCGCHCPRLPLV